ncbi:MAG TPA: pyrimidine 5'-nucleotidase [Anaerolineales bacterium]|nr:pyrimidine 5'-nucleotidase [Anaerolineales bacterium]
MQFTTVFFDLDDTLYAASTGLWPALKERMTRYMVDRMQIPAADVPRLRETYFRQHGTTLRGLQANHEIDVDDYLAYVHDVRLGEYLQPDAIQQRVLAALRSRNLIFTNADANHARRVLRELQIEQYFVDIIDVNRMAPYCKPSPQAFALALKIAGETDATRCAMIDDLPHTTRAARDFGMFSVLFGAQEHGGDANAACPDWSSLPSVLGQVPA